MHEEEALLQETVARAVDGTRVQPSDRLALAACQLALAAKELPHTIEAQNMLRALSPEGANLSLAEAGDSTPDDPLPAHLVAKAMMHLTQAANQMPHALGAHQMLQALDGINPQEAPLPTNFTMDDVVGLINDAADAEDTQQQPQQQQPQQQQQQQQQQHSPLQAAPFSPQPQAPSPQVLSPEVLSPQVVPHIEVLQQHLPPPPMLPAVTPVVGSGQHLERKVCSPQVAGTPAVQSPQGYVEESPGVPVGSVPVASPAPHMVHMQQQMPQQMPQQTPQQIPQQRQYSVPSLNPALEAVSEQQQLDAQMRQLEQLMEMKQMQAVLEKQQAALSGLNTQPPTQTQNLTPAPMVPQFSSVDFTPKSERRIMTPANSVHNRMVEVSQQRMQSQPQPQPYALPVENVPMEQKLESDRAFLEYLVTMHRRMAALPANEVNHSMLAGMMLQIDNVKARLLTSAATFAAAGGDLTETASALSNYLRGQSTPLPPPPASHQAPIPRLYPQWHTPL